MPGEYVPIFVRRRITIKASIAGANPEANMGEIYILPDKILFDTPDRSMVQERMDFNPLDLNPTCNVWWWDS